jgi:hypothetical protein
MNYKEFLEQVVKECYSKADLCRALGKKPTGGNYTTIDKLIKDYNLNISHFKSGAWNKGIKYTCKKYTLDEILIKNSPYKNTHHLKERLIKEGILKNECAICGCKERLELHHINGDSSDNRIENLQILCINHHYDTPNFRNKEGKGRIHLTPDDYILSEENLKIRDEARILAKRKGLKINEAIELIKNSPNKSIKDFPKKRPGNGYLENKICPVCHKEFHPRSSKQKYCSIECANRAQSSNISKEDLLNNIINSNGNFTQIGKVYGITDNAIRKWCKKYGFPTHTKDLKEYIKTLK